MIRKDFNRNWLFSRDSSGMMDALYGEENKAVCITLPHDAMILEEKNAGNPTGNAGAFYPGGNYFYTKEFTIPEEDRCKSIFLKFEGVYNRARVYANGQFVTSCHYGYTEFTADLTPYLNDGGSNTVLVKATNQDVPNGRWYTGSGIYRPVWLYAGNRARIAMDGIRISTPDVDEELAVVEIRIQLQYDDVPMKKAFVETVLTDQEGHDIMTEKTTVTLYQSHDIPVRQRLYLTDPKLWSVDTPNLYTCHVRLSLGERMEDEAEEHFGIRRITADPKRGLRVNGVPIKLRGACIHHDNGVIGSVTLAKAEERRVRGLKAAGFNAIRMAHNPASRELLDACDRIGMLLMEETYDMWNESKLPFDYALDFADHWEQDLQAVVAKDFNHPCVFMYSVGNEIGEFNQPGGNRIHRELCEKFRVLDPTRYVTNAVNGMVATMAGIVTVMQDLGMLSSQPQEENALGGGINDIMTTLMGRMNDLAVHPLVSDVLDETFSTLDLCGYNYMRGRYPMDHEMYPNRIYYGSETLPSDIDLNWKYVREIPSLLGDFTWTGWDYLGEAGAGVPRYGNEAGFFIPYPVFLAGVGDIDITGFRRPISYYREIVWGLRKEPYAAVQLPEHYTRPMHGTPWVTTDAIGSWTFPGSEGKPVRIEVYSDAEQVELRLNGKSIGIQPTGESKRFMTVFDAYYEPGIMEAIAYRKGQAAETFSLRTAAQNTVIRASVNRTELYADGQDAVFVEIEAVDASGTADTSKTDAVSIEVSGAGYLQGCGNADPRNEENYSRPETKLYYGRALAIIRAGHESGKIHMHVKTDSLGTAELSFNVNK